jgi:predicted nucleic acid-binding protein
MARTVAYFDSSVVVKRYVREAGADLARVLIQRHQLLSSVITPTEITSALCRRSATGEISDRDFTEIITRLRSDRANWNLVEISRSVLDDAELMLGRVRVRTLDAVQLASARTAEEVFGRPMRFITADGRQRAAAAELGLDVIWVE